MIFRMGNRCPGLKRKASRKKSCVQPPPQIRPASQKMCELRRRTGNRILHAWETTTALQNDVMRFDQASTSLRFQVTLSLYCSRFGRVQAARSKRREGDNRREKEPAAAPRKKHMPAMICEYPHEGMCTSILSRFNKGLCEPTSKKGRKLCKKGITCKKMDVRGSLRRMT